MRQMDNVAQTTAGRVKAAFGGMVGVLAGGMALAGLKSMMNDFDRVGKLATRFGTSAESIQRVSVAANIAGTSIDEVAKAMTKAGIAASRAANGNEAAAKQFASLGIDARAFADADIDQKLIMVSEALARAGGDADKTNTLIEILGTRGGANLLPLLGNTAALKKEMAGVAVVSSDMVKKIEEANDRMTRLGNTVTVGAVGGLKFLDSGFERLGNVAISAAIDKTNALKTAIEAAQSPAAFLARIFGGMLGKTNEEVEELERGGFAEDAINRAGAALGDAEDAAEDYGDAAKDAHDAAAAAAAKEVEAIKKITQAYEDAQRSQAQRLRSAQHEMDLLEMRTSGDPAKIAQAQEWEDWEEGQRLGLGGSAEDMAKWLSLKAKERAMREAGGGGGGGPEMTSPARTALEQLQDMGTVAGSAAAARVAGRGRYALAEADKLEARGMYRSAEQIRDRVARQADRRAEQALEKLNEDASKPEAQKKREAEEIAKAAEGAKGGGKATIDTIAQQILTEIKSRLPVVALGT
jgi:hypothetical protein